MSIKLDLSSDVLDSWQEIVELMAELLEAPSAIITAVQPPQIEVFRSSSNPDNPYAAGTVVEMSGHYCEEVIRTRRALEIPDARQSPRWQNAPELEYGVVSYLGYPILWPTGEPFGTICVLDVRQRHYAQRTCRLIERFRDLVQSHLTLMERNRQLEESRREIHALQGILPICAGCKKIRDDEGFWQQVEVYISEHSEAEFSHGLCPECIAEAEKQLDML